LSTKSPGAVFLRDATGLTRQLGAKDALMFNLLNMGIPWTFFYLFFALQLFPGVNLPLTVLVGYPLVIITAITYYFLTTIMPRTGGDFVWVGRIIHPSIGFMNNFALAIFFLSFLGPVSGWLFSFGIQVMFTNLSTITGNAYYSTLASSLSGTTPTFIAGLIVLGVISAVAFAGFRWAFRFQWVMFGLVILGTLAFLISMATTSNAQFISNFNQLSGINYNNVITSARSSGFSTGFTITGTLLGSTYSFLNYYGYNFSTFVGGEVKNASKSQLYGILGSTAIFGAFMFLVFESAYLTMGQPFLHAAAHIYGTPNSAWTLPQPPILQYLVIYANSSPIVAILVPLAIIGSVFGSLTTIILAVVRQTFAWSFDRIVPTKFSEVDSRRSSPVYALALIALIGLIFIILNDYTNIFTYLAYETAGLWATTGIVGLAAMILPFRRKDIFNNAPVQARHKWSLVVLGLLGFIGSIAVAAISLSPAYLQATTGGAAINSLNIVGLLLTFLIGFVIYFISYGIRRSRGINLGLAMREIPPE
jgi:APA family basic amino acid/polyamine antiporter